MVRDRLDVGLEPVASRIIRLALHLGAQGMLVKGLNSLPKISCIMPKGAFYTFPNIKKTGMKSTEFAEKLFKEVKVAVVPGNTFGESGEGHVRCSYSVSRQNISEALERMEKFLEKIK